MQGIMDAIKDAGLQQIDPLDLTAHLDGVHFEEPGGNFASEGSDKELMITARTLQPGEAADPFSAGRPYAAVDRP